MEALQFNVNMPMFIAAKALKGVYGYGLVIHQGQQRHVFDIALEFMRLNLIQIEDLITHKFKLGDFMEMIHVNMNKGKYKAIKTLVSFAW